MHVYLLRHGIAEDGRAGQSDADRGLTGEGRKKLQQVLERAAKAGVNPTLILSSPLKRALQTAEIAKETLGHKDEILTSKVLAPGSNSERVWQEIRGHRDQEAVLLVGHNPLFSDLTGYLLGHPNMQMDFKKGAIVRVDLESFGAVPRGVLRWYLTAKLADGRN
jgi:phosphohistidine phosphatase